MLLQVWPACGFRTTTQSASWHCVCVWTCMWMSLAATHSRYLPPKLSSVWVCWTSLQNFNYEHLCVPHTHGTHTHISSEHTHSCSLSGTYLHSLSPSRSPFRLGAKYYCQGWWQFSQAGDFETYYYLCKANEMKRHGNSFSTVPHIIMNSCIICSRFIHLGKVFAVGERERSGGVCASLARFVRFCPCGHGVLGIDFKVRWDTSFVRVASLGMEIFGHFRNSTVRNNNNNNIFLSLFGVRVRVLCYSNVNINQHPYRTIYA